MPYIDKKLRTEVDEFVELLSGKVNNLPEDQQDGVMNYIISQMIRDVYPLKYRHQNRLMGMLECVKQEHYRRVIAPYEEIKIAENGDIDSPRTK